MQPPLSCVFAFVALAGTATAQVTTPFAATAERTLAVTGPIERYTLDYASGRLTRTDEAEQVGVQATSSTAYDNSCTTGFWFPMAVGEEVLELH